MGTTMRTTVSVAVLLALTGIAAADPTGVYDVKYEEVSTNCQSPLRYAPGKLTIKVTGKSLTVDIDRTPLMGGIASEDKISAKSKSGGTMVDGMTGVFSVAGKVSKEGLLSLVMVGEYSANGKPLCTQSWNVSGPKNSAASSPKKTRASLDMNPMAKLLALR